MRTQALILAVFAAVSVPTLNALAQTTDHHSHDQESPPAPVDHSKMDHSTMDHSKMDHSKMDHSKMDHSKMDHSKMDHSKMDHSTMDHSKMDHSKMDHSNGGLRTPIPPVTEADRQAAFPELHAHHVHGTGIYNYFLLDRLEVNKDDELAWEARSWIGGDVQKFVMRSEGTLKKGRAEHANVELLYSRGVRAWWDVVGGVKQDFGNERNRTWAAVGVHGMAPMKFEVSATGYVSNGGRTAAVLEGEYTTLVTNRLIVQWRSEATLYGRSDPVNHLGSGLSSTSAGVRMRYEVTRRFAPYIGVEHERLFGGTADYARTSQGRASDTSVVAGVRLWF